MEVAKQSRPETTDSDEGEEEGEHEKELLLLGYDAHSIGKEWIENSGKTKTGTHSLLETMKEMYGVTPGASSADICRLAKLPIVTHVPGEGKPLKLIGAASCKSPFHANEDRVLVIDDFRVFLEGEEDGLGDMILDKLALIVVLDGHGGSWAASYTQLFFPRALIHQMRKLAQSENHLTVETLKSLLFDAVVQIDREVVSTQRQTRDTSGCCFLAAALYLDSVVTANAGDCRAIKLSRNITRAAASSGNMLDYCRQLTQDHTVKLKCERLRVISEGGKVLDNRINGILEPSRAIGDVDFKPTDGSRLLIADPDTTVYTYKGGDEILVLATDGVWDGLCNAEVVDEVQFQLKKNAKSPALVAEKLQSLGTMRGYDDVSVIVVYL